MRVAFSSLLLGVGFSLLPHHTSALTEQVRECNLERDRVVCVDDFSIVNNGNKLKLSCGGDGSLISKVKFASFGTPNATCPTPHLLENEDPILFSADSGCGASSSKKVVEDACLEKESCSIDVAGKFSGASSGLGSCGGLPVGNLTYVVNVECEDPFDVFQVLIALVIAFIGIGLGATLTLEAVLESWRLHKRAIMIGFASQFGIMPLIAFAFAKIMDFSPLVALGAILVGSVPGGVTSNLFTYWVKGNVAVSIMMSIASTVCSLFMLPLLLIIYVDAGLGLEGEVVVPFQDILVTLAIAIFPAAIGVAIRFKLGEKVAKYVEVGGSALGALFILAALVNGVMDNPDLFNPSKFPKTWIAATFFQPIGAGFGFLAAHLAKLTGPEARAVTLETAIQNYTIAISVVIFSFSGCERDVALTFVYVATFMYLINSLWLVPLLRFVHAPRDAPREVADEASAMKASEVLDGQSI